jgi:hypothetical protein
VAVIALLGIAKATPAAAQACCAGGALVSPARLALHEDYAVGLQVKVRDDLGAFDDSGRYVRFQQEQEQDLEQDFAASFRLSRQAQVGVVLPIVQTHRVVSGLSEWGGGIGDVALNARYDFLSAAEALYWPGFGLLASAVFPTGTPSDQAKSPLATDATGAGTYNLTIGADVEKVLGHAFASLNAWMTYRFDRTVATSGAAAITESFALQWTALAVAGYVFDSEAALGLYLNVLQEGDGTVNGTRDAGTSLRLSTAGLVAVLPFHDVWRLQGSLFSDVLISSFGRNEPAAGLGLTVTVIRVWM